MTQYESRYLWPVIVTNFQSKSSQESHNQVDRGHVTQVRLFSSGRAPIQPWGSQLGGRGGVSPSDNRIHNFENEDSKSIWLAREFSQLAISSIALDLCNEERQTLYHNCRVQRLMI